MEPKKQDKESGIFLPAEWYRQSGVQLTWPHRNTDWCTMLEEVEECFIKIAKEIAATEFLLIVSPEIEDVRRKLQGKANLTNILFFECDSNDTWARDHGAITSFRNGKPQIHDFCFNGWGMKFAANHDNQINRQLCQQNILIGEYNNHLDFVLEGGSLESDGKGTLLVTSTCLLSPNRNDKLSKEAIGNYLKTTFNLQQILWLDYGYLAGDDTDSHIDTLARLCPDDTIVYVQCNDPADEHYNELAKMEEQLKSFITLDKKPFKLLPLPMADAVYDENGGRLPATYANFLIINDSILYPIYNQEANDQLAGEVLSQAFPDKKIRGINCLPLIKQHGSLHCVTMQYPEGVIKGE